MHLVKANQVFWAHHCILQPNKTQKEFCVLVPFSPVWREDWFYSCWDLCNMSHFGNLQLFFQNVSSGPTIPYEGPRNLFLQLAFGFLEVFLGGLCEPASFFFWKFTFQDPILIFLKTQIMWRKTFLVDTDLWLINYPVWEYKISYLVVEGNCWLHRNHNLKNTLQSPKKKQEKGKAMYSHNVDNCHNLQRRWKKNIPQVGFHTHVAIFSTVTQAVKFLFPLREDVSLVVNSFGFYTFGKIIAKQTKLISKCQYHWCHKYNCTLQSEWQPKICCCEENFQSDICPEGVRQKSNVVLVVFVIHQQRKLHGSDKNKTNGIQQN